MRRRFLVVVFSGFLSFVFACPSVAFAEITVEEDVSEERCLFVNKGRKSELNRVSGTEKDLEVLPGDQRQSSNIYSFVSSAFKRSRLFILYGSLKHCD
ncbi:MAG: hypothetical protein AAGA66_15460 [Bacteroidota bacterium]